jgi:hypothetical protein
MYMAFPAHVDHPIDHSTETRVAFALLGIGIGALIVIGTGGWAVAALITAEGIGLMGNAGAIGFYVVGMPLDTWVFPKTGACTIASGLPSVMLGPELKRAARADSQDTLTSGRHREYTMFEGSRTVMLGKEQSPMSRVGDRSSCGGTIANGVHSILVGGPPSKEGVRLGEEDSREAKIVKLLISAASMTNSLMKPDNLNKARGGAKAIGEALKAAGFEKVGSAVKWTGSTLPKFNNTAADWAKIGGDTGKAASDVGSFYNSMFGR